MEFEYSKISPDGFFWKTRSDGTKYRVALFSRLTQYQEHGQRIFKDVVQSWPEDLLEGPSTKSTDKEDSAE
jgi:hypothetical protein